MNGLTRSGILLSMVVTSLCFVAAFLQSPVDAYHLDITNFGMDVGVIMGYQIAILSMLLVGYRHLNDWMLLLSPVIGYGLYDMEAANAVAHVLHTTMDGIYTGLNSQNVAFDKQAVVTNFLMLSTVILLGYYHSKRERSWDRSFFLLLNLAMLWVIIAYHVALYFKAWAPYMDSHKLFVQEFSQEAKLSPSEDVCVTGYQIQCHLLQPAEAFPESPLFDGNPNIAEARIAHNNGYSFNDIDLYHSSVDDAYQRMYIALGAFMQTQSGNVLIYSNQLTPHFMTLANMLGSAIAAFLFIWLYAGAFLSLFHRKFTR